MLHRRSRLGQREPAPDRSVADVDVSDAPAGSAVGVRARERLTQLFDEHEARVHGYLLSRTGDRALAEDLTTETFLALARKAAEEPGAVEGVTAAGLVTIAHRRLIDHWRSESRRQRRVELVAAHAVGAATEVDPGSQLSATDDLVLDALATLPVRQRAALTLRYLDELSVAEVADVLGTSYRATESILARARLSFRNAFEEQEGRP